MFSLVAVLISAVKKQLYWNPWKANVEIHELNLHSLLLQDYMDCPTVVNNVETIAAVVPIINDGGEEYAKIGIGRSTGTKLISAVGNLKNQVFMKLTWVYLLKNLFIQMNIVVEFANGKR